jgi:hypothetical protein
MIAKKLKVATMTLAVAVAMAGGAINTGTDAAAASAPRKLDDCLHDNPNATTGLKNSCTFPVTVTYEPVGVKTPDGVKTVDLAPGQFKPYTQVPAWTADGIGVVVCPLHQKPYVGRMLWYSGITIEEAQAAGGKVIHTQRDSTDPGVWEINHECRAG